MESLVKKLFSLAPATWAGSPQQQLLWPVLPIPPCQLSLWMETAVPEKTHDFRQSFYHVLST